MNIAFRTDSSFSIGTGHIHRCLNIARKFKIKKIKCYFFTNDYPGNINKLIQEEFTLCKISTKKKDGIYSDKVNIIDANVSIKLIRKHSIDLIFLDNYLINEKWEKKVSKYCKIVLISDFLNRKSFCDYYINYNTPYENSFMSKNLDNKCKKLIGSDYSIIKDLPNLKKKKLEKKITVFMGGVDTKNYTTKLVNILSHKIFINFKKIIVIGVKNKNAKILENQVKNLDNFKIIKGNKKNLYSVFSNSKLVITGVNTSMHEHLALGLNSIVIAQNKLQNKVIDNLSKLNLINFIKYKRNITKYYISTVLMQKNLSNKNKFLKKLFDSKGTHRIVEYFLSKNITRKADLKKISIEDKFFLFKLVNDPKVIKNSLTKRITNFNEHHRWFEKAKKKENTNILIFKTINHKLGQVRFDKISKKKTFITYSIANEFRGKNIGFKMLDMALKKNSYKTPLFAIVRKKNDASSKIFQKLGFSLLKEDRKRDLIYFSKSN